MNKQQGALDFFDEKHRRIEIETVAIIETKLLLLILEPVFVL
jgi:hypothetical protein